MLGTHLFRRTISFVVLSLLLVPFETSAQKNAAPASADSSRPALGIQFLAARAPLNLPTGGKTPALFNGVAVVDYVLPGSPALEAGVKNGDIVMAMNGKRICNSDDVTFTSAMQVGSEVELLIIRDGGIKPIKVRIGSLGQMYPNLALTASLQQQIDNAAATNNYKLARNLCKRIPEDLQIESSMSCVDAYRTQWDYKALRKAVEALSVRCQNCAKSAYAHAWEQLPTTDEGIKANGAIANLMGQYQQAQLNVFRKMDQDYARSIAKLPPSELLTKYENMARVEGACRDVPPSASLVELMIQFAKQNGTVVLDEARAKAEEARSIEKSAKDNKDLVAAVQKWNEAIWRAPWWSEPYIKAASLLDKLGRPQEAAEISKVALLIPTASEEAAVSTPLPAKLDDGPATEESLQKCVGDLAKTEKGGDAERNTRLRCARIAGKLPSRPQIPDTAQRYFARGEAALELGQSPAEFQDAAVEFENALRIAPWWAEAHCNLGQANEKTAKLQYAIYAYQACLAATPNAANAQDIQKRIYKLEYAADREQKMAINSQIHEREAELRMQALTGVWINKDSGNPYSAVIKDGLFVATRTPPSDRYNKFQGNYVLKGTVNGDKIEGTFTEPPLYNTTNGCTTPVSELPMAGTISSDGKMMTLKYQSATFQTNGIRGNLFNLPKCTYMQKVGEQTVMMILQKQQ